YRNFQRHGAAPGHHESARPEMPDPHRHRGWGRRAAIRPAADRSCWIDAALLGAEMISVRLLRAAPIIAIVLAGCRGSPPGLERMWERRESAQSAFEMCIHINPRNPSACSAARTEYDAAPKDY